MPELLEEHLSSAFAFMRLQNWQEALAYLQASEALLEAAATYQVSVEPQLVLLTLHNLAYCHQQLNQLEECAAYLDGAAHHTATANTGQRNEFGAQLHRQRYLATLNVQISAVQARLGRPAVVLSTATAAYKLLQSYLGSLSKLTADWSQSLNSQRAECGRLWAPLYQTLIGKRSQWQGEISQQCEPSHIVSPMFFIEEEPSVLDEVNSGLETVRTSQASLLIRSCFFIWKALRMLKTKEASAWLRKALAIAKQTLPANSPLRIEVEESKPKKHKRPTKPSNIKTRAVSLQTSEADKLALLRKAAEEVVGAVGKQESSSSYESDYRREQLQLAASDLYGASGRSSHLVASELLWSSEDEVV